MSPFSICVSTAAHSSFVTDMKLGLERLWTPMWPCEWTWQDATTELIRFKEGWWAKKLAFDIPPDTVESRQMPLLVVIGWYAILRDWETRRFPAEL